MLNYNRILEHFQTCEIERLQKRVRHLEQELEAIKSGRAASITPPPSEQPPSAKREPVAKP